jgi:hypothetical protein
MGRPPIGQHAMTAAERMRRYRARLSAKRKALRNETAPADESPLAIVRWAWACATDVEKAEIRAWVWGDRTVPSEPPASSNGAAALLKEEPPPAAPEPDIMPQHIRGQIAPVLEGLKSQGRSGRWRWDKAEIRRLAQRLEDLVPVHMRGELFPQIEEIRQHGARPGPTSGKAIAARVRNLERVLLDI